MENNNYLRIKWRCKKTRQTNTMPICRKQYIQGKKYNHVEFKEYLELINLTIQREKENEGNIKQLQIKSGKTQKEK